MAKVEKTEPKVLGTVCNGKFRVIEYTPGIPLLEIGKTVLGARKIKDVRSEDKACEEFLKKYDVPKPDNKAAELAQQAAALAKAQAELKALEAKLAAFAQPPTTVTRVDPLQKAA